MYRLGRHRIGLLLLIVLLVGCGRKDDMRKTSGQNTHAFFCDDQKVSNELMEAIIEGINNKDLDSIKSVFSINTINSDEDIDEEIQVLFDFIGGEITSYEEADPAGSFDSFGEGYKIRLISSYYYVSTSKEKFYFFINDFSVNTKEADKQGVKFLIVVKADDKMKIFDKDEKILFDENGKIDLKGIYTPDF